MDYFWDYHRHKIAGKENVTEGVHMNNRGEIIVRDEKSKR